jgi:ribosome hibernation promoting factor
MRLELRGHHVDITPALRRLVSTKVGKIEQLLNDGAVSVKAILTVEKHRHRANITLHARGERFLHGEAETDKWETSVSGAVEQIAQQAKKVKNKRQDRTRHRAKTGVAAAVAAQNSGRGAAAAKTPRAPLAARERVRMPPILRASRQAVQPMSAADAARQLDAGGDGVVVFRDLETRSISVLYRRPDGELALVETEA